MKVFIKENLEHYRKSIPEYKQVNNTVVLTGWCNESYFCFWDVFTWISCQSHYFITLITSFIHSQSGIVNPKCFCEHHHKIFFLCNLTSVNADYIASGRLSLEQY